MSESVVRARIGEIPWQVSLSDGMHAWAADESAALGGKDSGPNPHQLLLSALGACTAITVAMYARRKELPLTGIDIELKILEENLAKPAKVRIGRDIRISGDITPEQRQRLLEIANVCPLHKILTGEIIVDSRLI